MKLYRRKTAKNMTNGELIKAHKQLVEDEKDCKGAKLRNARHKVEIELQKRMKGEKYG